MTKQQQVQKKALSQSTATPSSSEFLQMRPFAETNNTVTEDQQAPPDLQAQVERASRFGHSFGKLAIQPKLTIGQPGDKYEQEADAVAAQVVQRINAPTGLSAAQGQAVQRETAEEEELQMKPLADSIQRQEAAEEEELQMKPMVQRREAIGGGAASRDLEQSIQSAKGGGQPLDKSIRQPMEQAFGADFSGVKIHTDAQSDQLNQSIQAKAFTTGQDVFFRQGAYEPQSRGGQELLAHELTHVVQQSGGAVQCKPAQPLISRQSSLQISRSPADAIQRLLWTSDQFSGDIAEKVKERFSTPVVSTLSQLILKKLQAYEKAHLDMTVKYNDIVTPQDIENRIDEIKRILNLVPEARDAAQTDEIRSAFTQFEESLIGELRGLEAKQRGEAGEGASTDYIENYFEYIYNSSVYNPIFSAVCNKLGLERGEWRRSDKLNAFRDSLKKAARSQAYTDVDTLIDSQLQAAQKDSTEVAQSYYGQKAKIEAYTTAKVDVVNEVVKDVAREITVTYAPKKDVLDQFRQAVDPANNPSLDIQKAAVQAKAKEIVKEHVGVTKGASASGAIATARTIAKGNSKDAEADRNTLIKQVTTVAQEKEIGKKAIQKVITEDTLEKGFQRTAQLIDFAAPTPGTSCEVDIQIKVPIHSGVYFTTQVKGSAEKDEEGKGFSIKNQGGKQEVETSLEVSMGAGWSAVGIDVNAQAGFFFKSTAENSQKAMGLVSYGFYRKLQGISPKAAAKVWGSGGEKLDKEKGQENLAESWGAMMEEWLFYERDKSGNIVYETDSTTGQKTPKINEDAAVEVGAMGKGGVKGNVGIGTLEAEAKYLHGTKFSAETVGQDALGKVGKSQEQMQKATAGQAKRVVKLTTSLDIKALEEAFGCSVELSLAWLPNLPGSQLKFSDRVVELEVEGAGKVNTKFGGKAEAWQKLLVSFGTSLASAVNQLCNLAKQQEQSTGSNAGAMAGAVGDYAYFVMDMQNVSGDAGSSLGGQLVESFGEREDKFAGINEETGKMSTEKILEVKQAFEVAIKYGKERKKPIEPFERSIEVALKRVREIGLDVNFAKAKAESKTRLARFQKKW